MGYKTTNNSDGQVNPLAVDDAVGERARRRHQAWVFLPDLGQDLLLGEVAAVVSRHAIFAGELGAVGGRVEALWFF